MADLFAATCEFQPTEDFCCCFAVPPEIVAVDADIIDPEHAAFANKLADTILGETPLVRIGLAPKQIRIYRAGNLIRSRKLHPLEIFCGSGQFIAFGWHAKAGRPYVWPKESPLTVSADDRAIPAITQAQLDQFTYRSIQSRYAPLSADKAKSQRGCFSDRVRTASHAHDAAWFVEASRFHCAQ